MTLAETRNFRRAAERLHISQPPLTVAIKKLERELGATLFVRGPRGVSLTSAGQVALGFAQATLAQAENFRDAVRKEVSGQHGRLRVGFVGSATYELMPRIIPAFRERYPLVELMLEEATSVSIARRIEVGDLDVGLVRLPLQENIRVLVRSIDMDELCFAVPSTHVFAGTQDIDLATARDEPFIMSSPVSALRGAALLACRNAGFAPRVAQDAEQINAILSLVRSGLGVALVPGRCSSGLPMGVKLVSLKQSIVVNTGVALPVSGASAAAKNFAAMADIGNLSQPGQSILDGPGAYVELRRGFEMAEA